jgi:hypothetical protein
LVGEAAFVAAMLEVHALEHDLSAKLKLISRLPAGLRERVAYEAFAAGFDHYLPKKFIHNFVWGRGADLTLTLREMIDCNPSINLLRSKSFRELLAKLTAQARKSLSAESPFELGILAGAFTNGTLGQFTARTKGTLVVENTGGWEATGSMTFYDEWDFDPKDFSTGGRSFQGEVKTRVANSLLPGQGFKIYSVVTGFSQSQDNSAVVWAGGTPKAEPDRVAALDIELSKPDK